MSKCPECKKEIDHLLHVEIVKQYWKAIPSTEEIEDVDYPELIDQETEDTRGYICPECNEQIANEREEAYHFLKGDCNE